MAMKKRAKKSVKNPSRRLARTSKELHASFGTPHAEPESGCELSFDRYTLWTPGSLGDGGRVSLKTTRDDR